MEFLSSFVQQVVSAIYEATRMIGEPSYGLAIIIMTILIKLLLYPLTKRQIASTKAMSRIQPRMKELQMRYRDDKMKLNEELSKPVTAVATGGLAEMFVPYCKEKVIYNRNLLLDGLWILYQKNKKEKR